MTWLATNTRSCAGHERQGPVLRFQMDAAQQCACAQLASGFVEEERGCYRLLPFGALGATHFAGVCLCESALRSCAVSPDGRMQKLGKTRHSLCLPELWSWLRTARRTRCDRLYSIKRANATGSVLWYMMLGKKRILVSRGKQMPTS